LYDEFFIERRPEGAYAVRKPNADRASAIESTQADAIARARQMKPQCDPPRGAGSGRFARQNGAARSREKPHGESATRAPTSTSRRQVALLSSRAFLTNLV
jgi:hypothetical protein